MSIATLKRTNEIFQKGGIYLVLLVLVIGIGIIKPSFLTLPNLLNILRISSVRIIIALGVGESL